MSEHEKFMKAAIEEARMGLAEGGIPIGSVVVKNLFHPFTLRYVHGNNPSLQNFRGGDWRE
jgi:tRNA(Arg) A34 adenosine deaminase TadA